MDAPSPVEQLARNADPGRFEAGSAEALDEAFEDVSRTVRDGVDPRRALNRAILTASEMDGKDQEGFLDRAYTDLLVEGVALKRMMNG